MRLIIHAESGYSNVKRQVCTKDNPRQESKRTRLNTVKKRRTIPGRVLTIPKT